MREREYVRERVCERERDSMKENVREYVIYSMCEREGM